MRIIRTDEASPNAIPDIQELDWVYNGLDCAVTTEVFEQTVAQLDDYTAATYSFSRALQGPALEMRLRGVLIDQARKAEVITEFREHISTLEDQLDRIVLEGVGMPTFNWRSNPDLHELFYTRLGIPPVRRWGKATVNREALEQMEAYVVAKPIISHMTAMRDLAKKIGVLQKEIDTDGRIRTSYNIAGTSTGRWSSSISEFGTGDNLQNIEESLRSVLIADPGYKFAKFDAKSGESYCVGAIEWNLFHDPRYLDAVESGDVHTAVARICWPNLEWTDDLKRDKDIAERPYYRHYTYRFMCKKLGHGSNYGGQPKTLAGQAKLPETVVRDFQPKYFRAFPSHIRWHGWVDTQLKRVGCLTTLTGRKRWFFGRRFDPSTFREAVAYDPQGSLADIVNRAMLRIWRWSKANSIPCYVMMQDHDALTFMYPEPYESEIIPILQELLIETIPLNNGRELTIPYDCKVGWNKGNYCCGQKNNPAKWESKGCEHCAGHENTDGLKDYTGEDRRTRRPQVSLLDRILHR